VDEAVGVDLRQPFGHLPRELDDRLGRHATPARQIRQGPAPDQLHDHPVAVVGLDDVVDLDDGRVVQPSQGPCFPPQSPVSFLAVRARSAHPLERHRAIQSLVVALVDDAHPSVAEDAFDPIRAEAGLVIFHDQPI